ncbi:MAG: hypothetical protein GWN87_24905 [Desulfuromonadales bacterium]|nr:hypothetical protein [Desulfuromonadales bacterium]
MQIYTGQTTGRKLEMIKKYELGICLSSAPDSRPNRAHGSVPCFLDNGAFACWRRGYPFQRNVFLTTLEKAYKAAINLDFIVCPDIVAGGLMSLKFSMTWAKNKLIGTPNLALAVQDDMTPGDLDLWDVERYFTYIFVGGTTEWKWATAPTWKEYADAKKMKIHIGRCGTLDRLKYAKKLGVTSVDSTIGRAMTTGERSNSFGARFRPKWT